MKGSIALGIGFAVVIISIVGIYVYSTTELISQSVPSSDSNEPITLGDKLDLQIESPQPKTLNLNVTDGFDFSTP